MLIPLCAYVDNVDSTMDKDKLTPYYERSYRFPSRLSDPLLISNIDYHIIFTDLRH